MRYTALALLIASSLAACTGQDPIAQQAQFDSRYDPVRADTMLAVGFRPGTSRIDTVQAAELKTMVSAGKRAERDEFVVVTDGSGGPMQNYRAQQVRQSLSAAGARWVGVSVEPTMPMGPDQVVVVRSEYRIAMRDCPDYNPATIANTNEGMRSGLGCADAYNMGQMLARPRDAAIGRDPGMADGAVSAEAVQRYREGRVRVISSVSMNSIGGGNAGGGGGGGAGAGGGAPPAPPAN